MNTATETYYSWGSKKGNIHAKSSELNNAKMHLQLAAGISGAELECAHIWHWGKTNVIQVRDIQTQKPKQDVAGHSGDEVFFFKTWIRVF